MSAIETYLQYIASKVWARDVRTAIVNAIRQCYDDVHNPTLNTEALQAAIQAKIDAGQMAALTIGDHTITSAKLADGVIPAADATLTQTGKPADAAATGAAISQLSADLGETQKFSRTITPIGQNKTVELTAGIAILASQKIINLSVQTGTIYYVYVDDPNGAIDSGNNVNIYYYGASGTGSTHIAAITTNTLYRFKAPADITAFALYISGKKIVESENIHLNVYYNEFNYSSLEQKIEDYHMYQLEQVASDNLFTSWEIGGLNISDGTSIVGENRLVSKGFIPVIGGQVYTINDPDKIADGARNAQFVYEYDVNHNLIQTQSITNDEAKTLSANTKYIKLLSQTVGIQSYAIGDYTNFKTMVFKGTEYMPYVSNHSVASGIGVENTSYKMASGAASSNAFSGKAFRCGSLNYSTGKVSAGNIIIATPLIPINGEMFYQMFDGKSGDVQFIFEYDSNGGFVKYTSTGTNYNGHITLDANTRFIRIRTQSSGVQSYVLPDIKWYDEHLVVSNEPINRYQNYLPVITQDDVSNNFYDTAVSFKTIAGFKSDIDTYAKTILETCYDVVIPIITDVHSTLAEPYDIHNYIAGKGIADVAFNLGDNIPNYYETRQEAIDVLENILHEEFLQPRKCEVYALCGNHDYNPYGSNAKAYTINQRTFYSISQARTKKGYAGAGKNYGYIDLIQAKIRIIWLDSGDIFDNTTGDPITTGNNTAVQQEQFTWFCNVALNFMDKSDRAEWAVVTLSHDRLSSLSDGGFATVIKAFMDGASASGTAYCVGRGSTIPQAYDVDFTGQGAIEYICHINGHYHEDNVIALGNTGRYQISIGADNVTSYYYDGDTRQPYTRTAGTIEEHCIDTFCLDKESKTIYMKRLGVGTDRSISYA